MTDDIDRADLAARIHAGLDPAVPRAGVEQRVLQAFHEHLERSRGRRFAWSPRLQTTAGGAVIALAVLALVGGALGITLALRGHPQNTARAVTPVAPVVPPIHPQTTAVPSPSPTSSAPSTISYVQPSSISFSSASDGWTVGNACDRQQRCEVGIARTSDGGTKWSLVASPVQALNDNLPLYVAASSPTDAWIWGSDANGMPVLAATHNGGASWELAPAVGTAVVDVVVADGTAWAETGCEQELPAARRTSCRNPSVEASGQTSGSFRRQFRERSGVSARSQRRRSSGRALVRG